MKKYIAILKQEGGCDYSIECGTKEILFKAENEKDAALTLKGIISDQYSHEERRISVLNVFELVNQYTVDVSKWYLEIDAEKKKIQQEQLRKAELEQLAILKKKYENG